MLSTIHVVIRPSWEGCKILIHKQASRYGYKQLKTKMFMLICCPLTDEKLISELVISCVVMYICTMCVASYRVSGKQQPTVTICTGRTLLRATVSNSALVFITIWYADIVQVHITLCTTSVQFAYNVWTSHYHQHNVHEPNSCTMSAPRTLWKEAKNKTDHNHKMLNHYCEYSE